MSNFSKTRQITKNIIQSVLQQKISLQNSFNLQFYFLSLIESFEQKQLPIIYFLFDLCEQGKRIENISRNRALKFGFYLSYLRDESFCSCIKHLKKMSNKIRYLELILPYG